MLDLQTLTYKAPVANELSDNEYIALQIEDCLDTIVKKDMQSEIPLFLNIRKGFIRELALRMVQTPNKNILIGVSGESASGKTTLANKILEICLLDRLKDLSTVIPSDNYYKDCSEQLKAAGSYEALFETGFNLDEPQAVDLDLLKQDLIKIRNGETIFTPEYNFFTIESIPNKIKKKTAKVILVEGLFVLEEKIREQLDISIYVHTPADIIKERWYKRAASRGKEGKAADMLFDIVNKGAQRYIRPYANHADIVISGLTPENYIKTIVKQIKDEIKKALI